MPYLKITCSEQILGPSQYAAVAQRLTQEAVDLFYNPRSPTTREEQQEHTTVHFTPYRTGELFIGGQTPEERATGDVTVELSDWSMSTKQQRKVARVLTPVLAELFGIPPGQVDGINIRFHSYPPTGFSVGGKLLAERVPLVGRLIKRWIG